MHDISVNNMLLSVVYPVIHVDWSPDSLAAATCSNLKEDEFGEAVVAQQGKI